MNYVSLTLCFLFYQRMPIVFCLVTIQSTVALNQSSSEKKWELKQVSETLESSWKPSKFLPNKAPESHLSHQILSKCPYIYQALPQSFSITFPLCNSFNFVVLSCAIMAKNVAGSPLERNGLASFDQKLAMAKRCSHGILHFLLSFFGLSFFPFPLLRWQKYYSNTIQGSRLRVWWACGSRISMQIF